MNRNFLIKIAAVTVCAAVSLSSLSAAYASAASGGVTLSLGGDYTSKQTGSVKVTGTSLNTVKDSIFGANVSWIDDGYGLWDSKNNEPYSVLCDKVKKSGVNHLRYPGGIEGDYLHWYETVGDMSARKAQINCFSSQYPTYDSYNGVEYKVAFGVDELFSVCKATGTKATVQLNAGNGTTDEARDYVNYLFDKDYVGATDSVCVGNEVCMAAENVEGMSVTKNPDEYISFCKELFAKLGDGIVNSAALKLGVIGITPSHPLCAYKNWDAKILDALAPQIDFIDVHIGYSYYYQGRASREDSVRCFMASAKWISSMVEEEKSIINKYAGENADNIGIQITELGPVGGDYPNSLAGAVFLADTYDTVLAEEKVTATDYLPLLNHYASAQLIGAMTYSGISDDEYYWDNAVSYVYKMYSGMTGRQVLKTDVSGFSGFDSAACGMVPEIKDVPLGNVSTYYDGETGKGSLFVLNRSLDSALDYNIKLPVSDARITGVTELWNKDYTAINSYLEPTNIKLKTYSDYSAQQTGSINVTTKPVSLVKIDFTTDSIQVVRPEKNQTSSADKRPSGTVSDKTETPAVKTEEGDGDSTAETVKKNETKEPETAKTLNKILIKDKTMLAVVIIVIALAAVLLSEFSVAAVFLMRRRKGKRRA